MSRLGNRELGADWHGGAVHGRLVYSRGKCWRRRNRAGQEINVLAIWRIRNVMTL